MREFTLAISFLSALLYSRHQSQFLKLIAQNVKVYWKFVMTHLAPFFYYFHLSPLIVELTNLEVIKIQNQVFYKKKKHIILIGTEISVRQECFYQYFNTSNCSDHRKHQHSFHVKVGKWRTVKWRNFFSLGITWIQCYIVVFILCRFGFSF